MEIRKLKTRAVICNSFNICYYGADIVTSSKSNYLAGTGFVSARKYPTENIWGAHYTAIINRILVILLHTQAETYAVIDYILHTRFSTTKWKENYLTYYNILYSIFI